MTARAFLPSARGGFTLVELLVSIVVLTMLTLALFNVLNATTTSWNRTEQRTDSYREARAALDVIARDLQTMVKSADFDFWAWKKASSPEDTTLPAGVTVTNYQTPAKSGSAVFLYSLQPRGAQDPDPAKHNFGQLCRIGFYLHYSRDVSGRDTYKLYRHFKMSSEVGNLTSAFSASADPNADEVLARNVVDFLLTPYWTQADGTLTTTEPNPVARAMPAMIEVRLLALSESAAVVLSTRGRSAWEDNSYQGTGSNLTPTQRVRSAGGQQFTTRVHLRSR